jgi:signal transduction histidine kinase/ActR/RegA family two-component response regulator
VIAQLDLKSDGAALTEEIRAEQLRLIFAMMAFGTPAGLAFAIAIATYFRNSVSTSVLLAFVVSKALIAIPRVLQGYRYRARHELYTRALESRALALMAVDGLWWGIVGSCAMRESTEVVAMSTAMLASVAAVATFGLQARFLATALYVVPILGMPSIVVLLRFDDVGFFIGLGLLILLILMLSTSARSELRLTEIFRLRLLATRTSEERGEALRLAEMRIERMEAEKVLQQEKARVDAMHETLQARGAFLARISHELRSPLQGIVSALDAFEFRYGHKIAEDDQLIARMRRSSILLNAQLRDLLTLARGQVGRVQLRPEPFDASALVEGVVSACLEAARIRGIELTMDVPPSPLFVVADAGRLDQILTNLVTNSIRYSDSGGGVHLELTGFDEARHRLTMTIRDTGPGIPEERVRGLFSPDDILAGTESKREASGIGLAIVGTLLRHLGGTVDVRSNGGSGTEFNVQIPAELIDPESVSSSAISTDLKRALVVDDIPEVLDALATSVEALGWRCDCAPSVASALNQLAVHRYDAVLVDVELPFKSGIEMSKELRRGHGPNQNSRLIGMSAADAALDEEDLPFDATVLKPIDRAALRAALEAHPASDPTQTSAPPTPPRTPACPSPLAPSSLPS